MKRNQLIGIAAAVVIIAASFIIPAADASARSGITAIARAGAGINNIPCDRCTGVFSCCLDIVCQLAKYLCIKVIVDSFLYSAKLVK